MQIMLETFYPRRYEILAYVTPYDHYRANGIRGAIFDIDNTLTNHDAPADNQAVGLFERLHQTGMSMCLLPNNKEPRVRHFADKVGSAYIHKAGEPKRDGYEWAMERIGTNQEAIILVGDQLLTGVCGVSRTGIYSTPVKLMSPREEIQIALKRYLEKPVLYSYKRQCRRKA